MTSDAENVRGLLASVTCAPFEIITPGKHRLLLQREARWLVACVDLEYIEKTAHLDRAWRDKEGIIWFETAEIADMTRLVEDLYGERAAASMPDPAIGELPDQSMPREVTGFPKVVELLKKYAQVLSEVGKKSGLNLRLLYDGGSGLTTVRIAVPTSFHSYDESETREVVEQVSKVLMEAYDQVLEASLAFTRPST
jgi:hypothetical protein